MSTFGLVLHRGRAGELARSTVDWLLERGHEVRVDQDDAAVLGEPDLAVAPEDFCNGTDLVLSLGGDGTMLRAVDLAAPEDVPVLGVNLGQLGYLTEVEPSGVRMALKRFLAGSYTLEERMRLEAVLDGAEGERPATALNEVVVEKSEMGHTVRLEVALDGRPFTSYVADGLILATPTGSTAYAFSAGGPIVWPELEALLVIPSNAHALFARPLVTSPESIVAVETVADSHDGLVFCDGRRTLELPAGARVEVVRGKDPIRWVRLDSAPFADRMVRKFELPVTGWRGRKR